MRNERAVQESQDTDEFESAQSLHWDSDGRERLLCHGDLEATTRTSDAHGRANAARGTDAGSGPVTRVAARVKRRDFCPSLATFGGGHILVPILIS